MKAPTMSNGHIGFVVYNDAVHINGVYNGRTGESHRARIPNYARVQFEMCGAFTQGDSCTYSLDVRQGIFRTTSDYDGYSVELVTYAHRYFDKTIVNHVTIRRYEPGTSDIYTVRLLNLPGSNSVDFDTVSETIQTFDGVLTTVVHLRTRITEHESYQENPREVYIYSQAVDDTIQLQSNEDERTFTYITSFGSDKGTIANIEDEYRLLLPIRDTILSSHTDEWNKFWTSSGISVEGNDELDKSIHSSLFFLSSALPSLNTSGIYQIPFYGLAPSGLGRGGILLSEYQGHSFWDTEIWMLPPVLLLEPEWSKAALNYRYQGRNAAADIAKDTGYEGYRFPWEGGYTGCETTPDCCPQNPFYQQHITAGVAYAYRSQFFATHDEEWMKSEGCEMTYKTAEFWASRVFYNSTDKLYEIIGVMGPDEDVWDVSNNPYTNVIAAYNLFFGEYAACYCNQFFPSLYNKTNGWDKIARGIRLLHDEARDYTPQHETFEPIVEIKQADTVLLGYPLMYPLATSTLRNNLNIYGNWTREDGPGMTWAMHAIGHMDIGEVPSEEMFQRSYDPYIRRPFYTWQEVVEPFVGVGNFITGAGGFLQLMLNGYGGIRLYSDRMTISGTLLPPNTTKLTINGFKYLNGEFSLEQTETSLRLTVKRFGNVNILVDDDLTKTQTIEFLPRSSNIFDSCQMAENIINIPTDF
ncbi:Protein-glucosylgalactosylhydroxylysine glucosidase, partial [Pseudolycoriella hygida]